jgi:sugar phosphate isomerase/epimerase
MKLGVFIAAFASMDFDALLDYVASKGVNAIEIPVGGC